MNPFQVLGLDPDAPDEQIEATYRHLVRAHHPDLHQGGSPEALAEAEARTRELNQAMALIRAGWRPRADAPGGFHFDDRRRSRTWWPPPQGQPAPGFEPPSRRGSWSDAYRADATTDFFGNPERRRRGPEWVSCPLCGVDFDDAVVLRNHLVQRHRLRDGVFPGPRPPRVRRDPFRWLRWVPVPQLTLTAVLFLYLSVVDGLVPAPWTVASLWLGFVAYALAMTKALSRPRVT